MSDVGISAGPRDYEAKRIRSFRGLAWIPVLAMLLQVGAVSAAEIPVRVFHSPANDGSFSFQAGPSDPTDPLALAELIGEDVLSIEDLDLAESCAFEAGKQLQKLDRHAFLAPDYVRCLRALQAISLVLLSKSQGDAKTSSTSLTGMKTDRIDMDRIRLFGWLSSEEAQTLT